MKLDKNKKWFLKIVLDFLISDYSGWKVITSISSGCCFKSNKVYRKKEKFFYRKIQKGEKNGLGDTY